MTDHLPVPVELTDAQLEAVGAGQLQSGLINVFANDVLSHNNVQVAVPVNASVAANVLSSGSTATAVSQQHPGVIQTI
jgi:hypothetical protein